MGRRRLPVASARAALCPGQLPGRKPWTTAKSGRSARRTSSRLSGHSSIKGALPWALCFSITATASAVKRPLEAMISACTADAPTSAARQAWSRCPSVRPRPTLNQHTRYAARAARGPRRVRQIPARLVLQVGEQTQQEVPRPPPRFHTVEPAGDPREHGLDLGRPRRRVYAVGNGRHMVFVCCHNNG